LRHGWRLHLKMADINIRCIEGIDLDTVPVQHFDGRSKQATRVAVAAQSG